MPLSFKGNDRESPQGEGKRIIGGGGVQERFGEGFYAEFSTPVSGECEVLVFLRL